jgi:hypothetical protein
MVQYLEKWSNGDMFPLPMYAIYNNNKRIMNINLHAQSRKKKNN